MATEEGSGIESRICRASRTPKQIPAGVERMICMGQLALFGKVYGEMKKWGGLAGVPAGLEWGVLPGLRLGGGCGVGHDAFEFGDVFEESLAAEIGEADQGLRAFLLGSFPDFDEAGFDESLQMSIEVAVGEGTEFLEIAEEKTGGVRGERRENAESGLFVNRSIETIV